MERLLCAAILSVFAAFPAYAESTSCADPNLEKSLLKPGPQAPNWTRTWRGQPPEKHVAQMKIAGQTVTVRSNKYLASTQPARSTVIFLCGGPGYSCSQFGRPVNLPTDVNVITFDYLGVGENHSPKLNNEALSIESQADVVQGLVKSQRLKNYVLYGHSFGTTVATVAASKMSHDSKATPPVAVVLEGVVGPRSKMDQNSARARTAARAWNALKPAEQAEFKNVFNQIATQSNAEQKKALNEDLQQSFPLGARASTRALREFIKDPESASQTPPTEGPVVPQDPDLGESTLVFNSSPAIHEYRAAGCQIFPKSPPKDPYVYLGGLVKSELTKDPTYMKMCACPLIDRPYDPAQHPIKNLPVLYVNSDMDPVTPMEAAVAHYDGQNETAKKLFLAPKDGGHAEFIQGRLANCADVVWDAVLVGDLTRLHKDQANLEVGRCSTTGAAGTASASSPPAKSVR